MTNRIMRLTVIFFCLLSTSTLAQPEEKKHKSDYNRCGHNINITGGASWNRYFSYELSVGRSYSAEYNSPILETFSQYAAGVEVLTDGDKNILAPKLSCELVILKVLNVSRLNLLYYLDPSGEGSLKYRHEVGVSYRGFVTVNYSWSFNLTNKSYYPPGKGFCVQLNVPLGKRRWDSVN